MNRHIVKLLKSMGLANDNLYTSQLKSSLTKSVSSVRLATYLDLVGNGSTADALELYAHNARLSGAFIFPVQAVEVSIRNLCNDVLSEQLGSNWMTGGKVNLVWRQERAIKHASTQHGYVKIDELNFGFWTQLFARRFDPQLWRNAGLYKVFGNSPPGIQRTVVYNDLNTIRDFRNRIAHHEQIISHDPIERYEEIIKIVDWIDEDQRHWVEHYSRVYPIWNMIQKTKNRHRWTGF